MWVPDLNLWNPVPPGRACWVSSPSLHPLFKSEETEAMGNWTCHARVPPHLFPSTPLGVGRRQTSDLSLAGE